MGQIAHFTVGDDAPHDCYRWPMRGVLRRLACWVSAMGWLGSVTACDGAITDSAAPEAWPSTDACDGLDEWPQAWAQREEEALERIDALRTEGADCGERGKWGPAPALRRRAALDCAARSHALDMATQGYFGRLDPQGADEHDRAAAAGYTAMVVQHLAAGPRDAAALIDETWLPRPVPCESLVSDASSEVGIGHVGDVDDELGTYWVLVLASPQAPEFE